jgi:hypothetical protein
MCECGDDKVSHSDRDNSCYKCDCIMYKEKK